MTSNKFDQGANFPYYIGACDGKHIRTIVLAHSRAICLNYRTFLPLVLLVIYDTAYKFFLIVFGVYGKFGNAAMLKNLSLYKKFLRIV